MRVWGTYGHMPYAGACIRAGNYVAIYAALCISVRGLQSYDDITLLNEYVTLSYNTTYGSACV